MRPTPYGRPYLSAANASLLGVLGVQGRVGAVDARRYLVGDDQGGHLALHLGHLGGGGEERGRVEITLEISLETESKTLTSSMYGSTNLAEGRIYWFNPASGGLTCETEKRVFVDIYRCRLRENRGSERDSGRKKQNTGLVAVAGAGAAAARSHRPKQRRAGRNHPHK